MRPNRRFFQRDTVTLARALLGQKLVRVVEGRRLSGVIVETEAYLGIPDKAAHTYGGRRTARTETMWGDGGFAYVYFTYGVHHCVNVVVREAGVPEAALIRALEPAEGLDRMRLHRPAARRDTDLCSGPGKLAAALSIDRALDGADLVQSRVLFIEQVRRRAYSAGRIGVTPRIGVDSAAEWAKKPLRFVVKGNPHLSRTIGQ